MGGEHAYDGEETLDEGGAPAGERLPIALRARPQPPAAEQLPGAWFTKLLYVVNGLLLLAIILLSLVLIRAR